MNIEEKLYVAASVLYGCGYLQYCYYEKVRRTIRLQLYHTSLNMQLMRFY